MNRKQKSISLCGGKEEIMQEKIQAIAFYYGFISQREILIEEMSELTQALQKIKRSNTSDKLREAYDNFIEELADVSIMIEQFKCYVNKDKLNKKIEEKLDRQIERMKQHEIDCRGKVENED